MENHKKRPASAMLNNIDRGVKIEKDLDENNSLANDPPNNGCPNVAVTPSYSDKTPKKIGFLGLDEISCELIKKLLSTGHLVTVWGDENLYNTIVEMGAKTARHPADVIQDCDVVFSFEFDAVAARRVVFGNHGVLAGINGLCNKAYVELTSIDPVTSKDIGEAIAGKGGRYLEAPMIGTQQDVINCSSLIVSAGDRSVLKDCNSAFACWASHVFFLSHDVGAANKMSQILKILNGTTLADFVKSLSIIVMLFMLLRPNMHSS